MLVTVHEAAELLRVTDRRLYELIRAGTVPAVHLGRQVRVSRAALEAFVRSGSFPEAAGAAPGGGAAM